MVIVFRQSWGNKQMKKSKVKMAMMAAFCSMAVSGSVSAAGAFDEVPASNWSYQSAKTLVDEGFLSARVMDQGMTRYDMAILTAKAQARAAGATPEQKAIIERLVAEYHAELTGIQRVFAGDVSEASTKAIAQKVVQEHEQAKAHQYPKVSFGGNMHVRWDDDKTAGVTSTTDNRHIYLSLEGTMQANENWTAHFQTEDKNRYVNHRKNQGDLTKFGQRLWITGKVGKTSVEVGRRWWWLGEGLMMAHSMDGIKWNFPLRNGSNLSVFMMHPDDMDGRTDAAGSSNGSSYMALGEYASAELYGVNWSGMLSRKLHGSLMLGMNGHTVQPYEGAKFADVTGWGEVGLGMTFDKNWRLDAAYTRTNANEYNYSWRVAAQYKGMQRDKPGSYGVRLSYQHLGRYGDLLHDDFWGYLLSDTNATIAETSVCLAPNLVWNTWYSWQQRNISGEGGYWTYAIARDYSAKDTNRRIFFTELAVFF